MSFFSSGALPGNASALSSIACDSTRLASADVLSSPAMRSYSLPACANAAFFFYSAAFRSKSLPSLFEMYSEKAAIAWSSEMPLWSGWVAISFSIAATVLSGLPPSATIYEKANISSVVEVAIPSSVSSYNCTRLTYLLADASRVKAQSLLADFIDYLLLTE